MKKYVLSLLSFVLVSAKAQEIIEGYDYVKAQQVNVMELGLGTLYDDFPFVYTVSSFMLPSGYKKWANSGPINAKITPRVLNGEIINQQMEYTDSIHVDSKRRNKVELKNILDRNKSFSLAWTSNQKKIESALTKFSGNLGKLSLYGATSEEIEHWNDYLLMYEFSVKVMQNGYQPNSKRDREFNEIYNDIVKKNESLCHRLVALKGEMEAKKFAEVRAMTRVRRIGYYAAEALQSWRKNAQSNKKE